MTTEKFGTNLPVDVAQEFRAFCEDTGLVMQRAVAAGLFLVQAAPPDLRDGLMRGNQDGMVEWLTRLSRWVSLAERTGDPNALEAAVEAALRDAAKPARAPASRRSKGRKVGG